MLNTNKNKPLSQWYVYDWNYGPPTGFVLRGRSNDNLIANTISKEMNILVKHIWGEGYSLNLIFTSHSAPIFQSSDKESNIKKARLVTKIWRYCKRNNIKINFDNFPPQLKHKNISLNNIALFCMGIEF